MEQKINFKSCYNSPIGNITLASDGKNLTGLWFEGQKYFGYTVNIKMAENNKLEIFKNTKNWLNRYFTGKRPKISELPLAPTGNDFRKNVWQILCKIPYGKVCTYGDIAQIIAKEQNIGKMSAQAVGGAIGHNPISIIIPCHRVVGSNGSLTGYAGGINTKIKLLEHEGVDVENLLELKKDKQALRFIFPYS
ncbi:MAG: methylated-DNA--[protein]-cysteine S-methyltransferase [Candidatus Gastranaerophilales bacterium]|nr:methylated-DNA--[protein]-cysteine S-methyltransferase [Candidatus Gastranaerophilales bacterium]